MQRFDRLEPTPPSAAAPAESVVELLERCAAAHPGRPAVEALGREPLEYGHLFSLVRSCAEALAAVGCRRDHRVAVVMPNLPETAVLNLALTSVATCVPLNPAYTQSELEALMRRLRVSILATTDHLDARAAARAAAIPVLQVRTSTSGRAGEFELHVDSLDGLGAPGSTEDLLGASPDETALVLHTSGSTAAPKIVPLTHRNLVTSAANVATSLRLGREDACLNAMPLFHVGALVDLLLAPLSVGGRVVIATGAGAREFFTHVDATGPTWYQGVPTMLQDILRPAEERSISGSRMRFIRSVSAPLPPTVLLELEQRFGVPVVEIYGMTETAGVITSNPLPPGERRIGSVGVSAGPEIKIVAEDGEAITDGGTGEVWVRGESVTAGYERDGRTADDSLVDGWLRTGDEGRLDEDGYLYLTGRIKDIINRGGEKIAPREVDELVLAHPGVRDAAAFAAAHDTLGEEVALAVVRAPGQEVGAEELIAYCSERIAPFKVPRQVFFCAELPRAPGGKLQRSKLGTLFSVPPATRPADASPPTDERQRLLVAIWKEVLGVARVGVHDDFVDLGGDSLRAVELAVRMSERLGFEVPTAAVYDYPTVHTLSAELDSFRGQVPCGRVNEDEASMLSEIRAFLSTWEGDRPIPEGLLVGHNTSGRRPPLFWGVQSFGEHRDFADHLGTDQPVYAMRSLYQTRSKSAANSVALARHYLAEIQSVQPEGPVHLGGYCAGGGIALDVARGLQAMGREVASLCLIEHYAPGTYRGRVAFFFHAESGWHPFHTAEPDWLGSYTGPVRLHPSHAGHEGVLTDPVVLSGIRRDLNRADPGSSGAPEDYRVSAGVLTPRVWVSRSSRRLELTVENRGHQDWPAGTAVFSRWGRPGSDQVSFDASATIEYAIEPGQQVTIPLDVRAPLSPGVWISSFNVVPGGDWNGSHVQHVARKMVTVMPGTAVLAYVRDRLPQVAPAALLRR